MFLTDFDSRQAIIEPGNVIEKIPGMPKTCMGVFSHVLVDAWVAQYNGEEIARHRSVCGDRIIYKVAIDHHEFALFVPHLGAPGAVGNLEELIASGVEAFVFCGCCGVLRHGVADGHIIVPTAAIRDEGTSFHYATPSDEIVLDPHMTSLVTREMEHLGLPFVTGKVWTTDAFFRETPGKMQRAKEMGALCVDMECAALAAAAQFRGVPFVQFFWAADNLDAPEWDSRGLPTKGLSVSERCMMACLALTRRLAAS